MSGRVRPSSSRSSRPELPGQPDVAEHDGERLLVEQLARLVDGSDAGAVVASLDDDALDQRAHLLVVVDAQTRSALIPAPARAGTSVEPRAHAISSRSVVERGTHGARKLLGRKRLLQQRALGTGCARGA